MRLPALPFLVALALSACATAQPLASGAASGAEAPLPTSRNAAGTQRALLVAIDTYNPPGATSERSLKDLAGPLNDLRLMREVLVERGFDPAHIDTLTEAAATREGILGAIRGWIGRAQPGDHLTFFFAGHGSYVDTTREASGEADGRLETIVPSDAARGASDIVDKELRQLWNLALDRIQGADDSGTGTLTVIQDNCHSGSGSRSALAPTERKVDPARSARLPEGGIGPPPNERGALLLSASRDYQPAVELFVTGNLHGGASGQHGGFSASLARALRSTPPGAPARLVMERTKALVHDLGLAQVPVVEGPDARPLFGEPAAPGGVSGVAIAAVEDDVVVLRGGAFSGLGPGAELVRALTHDGRRDETVRLRVRETDGAVRSYASVTAGSADSVRVGDVFRITKATLPPGEPLLVWLPPEAGSEADVLAAAEGAPCASGEACTHAPAGLPAGVVLATSSGWRAYATDGATTEAETYRPLPPTAALRSALAAALDGAGGVTVVSAPEAADYWLAGEIDDDGALGYRWVRKDAVTTGTDLVSLPFFGTALPGTAAFASALAMGAERLALVKSWLTVPEPDAAPFPVEVLGLQRRSDGLVLRPDSSGVLTLPPATDDCSPTHDEQCYRVAIGVTPEALAAHRRAPTLDRQDRRYGYAFMMEPDGESCLLLPYLKCDPSRSRDDFPLDLSDASRFALAPTSRGDSVYVFDIDEPSLYFNYKEPVGRHTLVLLTTTDPFDGEAEALQWPDADAGLRSRGPQGEVKTLPTWGLHRLTLDLVPGAPATPTE